MAYKLLCGVAAILWIVSLFALTQLWPVGLVSVCLCTMISIMLYNTKIQ
jgi:hypothetical protein